MSPTNFKHYFLWGLTLSSAASAFPGLSLIKFGARKRLEEQAKHGNIGSAPAGVDDGNNAVLLSRASALVRQWW
jgi:hypothetical protein